MAKFRKSISIQAPVVKVFGYMADPTHLPEIWPSMIEVNDVKKAPDGNVSGYHWAYKMAGMRFEGTSEIKETIPNQRVVVSNPTGIPSTFVWTYEHLNGDTQLTIEVEYTIPVPLLGKLAETFIVKQNENEADIVLANLKSRMEG